MAYQIIASQDADAVYPETELRPRITAVLDSAADVEALGGTEKWSPGSLAILAEAGFPTLLLSKSNGWVNGNTGGSGGGSGLPSGSSPNQYLVTDGDGNAKWEDKLCWSESSEEVVQPECQPELQENNESFSRFYIDGVANLTVGETYIVNWNGVEYRCVAKAPDMVSFDAAPVYAVLGNIAKAEETGDTGEPFLIRVGRYSNNDLSEYQIYAFDGATELTLSIRRATETIHKMSGKLVEGMGWSEKSSADMTWDGVVPDGAASPYLHKVGEAINPSDLVGATIETYVENTGDTLQFIIGQEGPFAEIQTPVDGLYMCKSVCLATKPVEFDGVSISESGVYFIRNSSSYPARLSFPETIHPIDKKYLPSGSGCLVITSARSYDGIIGETTANMTFAEAYTLLLSGAPTVYRENYGDKMDIYSLTMVSCSSDQIIVSVFNGNEHIRDVEFYPDGSMNVVLPG